MWNHLGPTWRALEVQFDAKLRQVGFKLDPDGPKIGSLRALVAHLQGVQHRIDDLKYFESSWVPR